MVEGVELLMLLSSTSGTATLTFTWLTSRMVSTPCDGLAVSPANSMVRPTTPLTGAVSRVSERFLRAMRSIAFDELTPEVAVFRLVSAC